MSKHVAFGRRQCERVQGVILQDFIWAKPLALKLLFILVTNENPISFLEVVVVVYQAMMVFNYLEMDSFLEKLLVNI